MLLDRFENPPHALLLIGDGKKEAIHFALKTASVEKLPHPDIHEYFPEGKTGMHAIASLRSLLEELILAPYEAKKKCFILYEADKMLPSSSNALLKAIEEPPPKTLFLLLTKDKDKILPTIRSRCQIVYFPETSKAPNVLQEIFSTFLENPLLPKLEETLKAFEEGKKEREKELLKALPNDLMPHQKEAYEKEISGAVTLQFQEEFFSLLELLQNHYLKKTNYKSFFQIDPLFQKAKLALTRHLSPRVILESLLIYLQYV